MGFIETVQQIIIDGSGCELSLNALQSQILLPTKLVKKFELFQSTNFRSIKCANSMHWCLKWCQIKLHVAELEILGPSRLWASKLCPLVAQAWHLLDNGYQEIHLLYGNLENIFFSGNWKDLLKSFEKICWQKVFFFTFICLSGLKEIWQKFFQLHLPNAGGAIFHRCWKSFWNLDFSWNLFWGLRDSRLRGNKLIRL